MRLFIGLVVTAVATGISGLFFMFASWHLHANYWEAIPSLGLWHALLVATMFSALFTMDSAINPDAHRGNPLPYIILSVAALPFLLYILVNYLNGNVFPALPDLSYGTALMLGFMSIPFQFVNWLLKIGAEDLLEN